MTARDDYPKLAEIAAYDMAEYGESPRFGAALDEIDRLRAERDAALDRAARAENTATFWKTVAHGRLPDEANP